MTNIWNTGDPCVGIAFLLKTKCNGDIDTLIRTVSATSCSRDAARQMSVVFAPCLGISEAEFMKRWKAVFKNRLERPAS